MRLPRKYPREYFDRFSTEPVALLPFDSEVLRVASMYRRRLNDLLETYKVKAELSGSTAYHILGKGEIEFTLFLNNPNWFSLIRTLKSHYGRIGNLEKDYARFNDTYKGYDVEIILERGHLARVMKATRDYLLKHKKLLKEYEEIKKRYAYSKREYQYQKNKFFEKVIKNL